MVATVAKRVPLLEQWQVKLYHGLLVLQAVLRDLLEMCMSLSRPGQHDERP